MTDPKEQNIRFHRVGHPAYACIAVVCGIAGKLL